MRKFLIIWILILIPLASAEISVVTKSCSKQGVLYFEIDNDGENVPTEVYSKYSDGIEDLVLIDGGWNDNKEIFRSDPGEFLRVGLYDIIIGDFSFKVDCPGTTFDCSYIDFKINDCYTYGTYFTLDFTASGLKQSLILSPTIDIQYKIETENKVWSYGVLPSGTTVKYQGNDRYLLRFKTDDPVKEVYTLIEQCKDPNTKNYKRCTVKVPDTTTTRITTTTEETTSTSTTSTTTPTTSTTTTTIMLFEYLTEEKTGLKGNTLVLSLALIFAVGAFTTKFKTKKLF